MYDNVNDYYSAFDIFILPSLWEGLPVVVMEAQYSNLLCILSKNIDERAKLISSTKFLKIDNFKIWSNYIAERVKTMNLNERFNNIEIYQNANLDIQIEKAEEDKKKNQKMYKTLGVTIGLIFVIILF